MTTTPELIHLATGFYGVALDGAKIGQVIWCSAGWMAQGRPADAGSAAPARLFENPAAGANWLAEIAEVAE